MKMYYFNPNDYDETFVTCAESKEKAYANVISYLIKKANNKGEIF